MKKKNTRHYSTELGYHVRNDICTSREWNVLDYRLIMESMTFPQNLFLGERKGNEEVLETGEQSQVQSWFMKRIKGEINWKFNQISLI